MSMLILDLAAELEILTVIVIRRCEFDRTLTAVAGLRKGTHQVG